MPKKPAPRNSPGGELHPGIAAVLLVTAIGLALALQGWRSRTPTFDLFPFVESAHAFLEGGLVPDRGTLNSFGSYTPPGTTWLILPGVLAFADPRLSESVGSATLYVGTLVGLLLLVRTCFGLRSAVLSVVLYGFSTTGLYFAASLWPRGHPFFYVWIVYWIVRWVRERSAIAPAAALVTWAAGMYVFMEIAPALFILPVVWLLYRPPIRLPPLIVAGALVLALWFPYLQFESTRGFADLRSQVLRQVMHPGNYRDTWCDRNLVLRRLSLETTQAAGSTSAIAERAIALFSGLQPIEGFLSHFDGLLSNFERVTPVPGANAVLLFAVLSSLIVLGRPTSATGPPEAPIRRRWSALFLAAFAIAMIAADLLANQVITTRALSPGGYLQSPTRLTIRRLQAALTLSAVLLLHWPGIAAMMKQGVITARRRLHVQPIQPPEPAKLLVLSLLIPWFLLLLGVEAGRPERFWWLWPLQMAVLAAFLTTIPSSLTGHRPIVRAFQALLVFVVVANAPLAQVDSWRRTGWSGSDAERVQVVDYVSDQLRADGRDRAAIGYQLYILWFMAGYNVVDSRYKVGADFDMLFKYPHRTLNADRCPEGVSPEDTYRIVQTEPGPVGEYFDIAPDRRFHLLKQVGSYQVLKRD